MTSTMISVKIDRSESVALRRQEVIGMIEALP